MSGDAVASSAREPCLLCEDRPRAVRLQCGHLFACEVCVLELEFCAMCRAAITSYYNISGAQSWRATVTSLSDSSRDDYVSSGSNTFVNMELCINGCGCEGTEHFTCAQCYDAGSLHSFALCILCYEQTGALCPTCGSVAGPVQLQDKRSPQQLKLPRNWVRLRHFVPHLQ